MPANIFQNRQVRKSETARQSNIVFNQHLRNRKMFQVFPFYLTDNCSIVHKQFILGRTLSLVISRADNKAFLLWSNILALQWK